MTIGSTVSTWKDEGIVLAVLVSVILLYCLSRRIAQKYGIVEQNINQHDRAAARDSLTDVEGQVETEFHPLPRTLIVWAAVMFPLNISASSVFNFVWPSMVDPEESLNVVLRVLNFALCFPPIFASMQVFLCAVITSHPQMGIPVSRGRVAAHQAMLSAITMPPLAAVWAFYVFPACFYGSTWVCLGASAYVLQGAVWMLCVRWSKRDYEGYRRSSCDLELK